MGSKPSAPPVVMIGIGMMPTVTINKRIKTRVNHMKMIQSVLFSALFSLACVSAHAAEGDAQWLFVQTAADFTSNGDTLTIPYEREIFAFTDRPNRQHAYLNATELTSLWNTGENTFAENPPNAVLTWVEDGEVREAEIILTAAQVGDQGRSITYQFQFEAGHALPQTAARVSLFIDGAYTAVWG